MNEKKFSSIWIQISFHLALVHIIMSYANDSFFYTQGDSLILNCPRDNIFSHFDVSQLFFHWDIATFEEGRFITVVSNNPDFLPKSTVLPNTVEKLFPNGTLYVSHLHDSRHMGEFQCYIADRSSPNNTVKSQKSFDIYVSRPPEITPRMENDTLRYNETKRLRCSALGNSPKIQFYVDGIQIKKLHPLSDQADYVFTKSVWVSCVAKNDLGMDNSTAYFSVLSDDDNEMLFECKGISLVSKSCSRYFNGLMSESTSRWRPYHPSNGHQLDSLVFSLFQRLESIFYMNATIQASNARCLEHFKQYVCSQTFPICSQKDVVKIRPVQDVFVCREHCLAIRNEFCGEFMWQLLLTTSFSSDLSRFQLKSPAFRYSNNSEDNLIRNQCESLTSVFSSTSPGCSPIDLERGILSQPVESCYHPEQGRVGKSENSFYAGDFHHANCVPWIEAETAVHPLFNHYVFPSLKSLQDSNSSACRNPGRLFTAPVCLIRNENPNSNDSFITRSCEDDIPKCLLIDTKPPSVDKELIFPLESKFVSKMVIIFVALIGVAAIALPLAFCFCVFRASHGKTKLLDAFLQHCCCKGTYNWVYRKLGVPTSFYDYGDSVLYASPEDSLDCQKQVVSSSCSPFLTSCADRNAITEYELQRDLKNIPGESLEPKHVIDFLHPKLRELEYPRNQLRELFHFGEGIYGGVILVEAPNMHYRVQARRRSISFQPDDFFYYNDSEECTEPGLSTSGINSTSGLSSVQQLQVGVGGRISSRKDLVVLKVLRPEADEKLVSGYFHEAELLVQLNHRNVIGLLGVCFTQKPLCMLQEYMDYRDLKNYLLLCRQDGSHDATRQLSEATKSTSHPMDRLKRLRLALQIAEGMVYISNKGYVHRDLATRNCLINSSMCVKISDFMMCVSVAPGVDYIADETESAPIRWIPLESIIERRYNLDTDVWSFGVLLWELFTLAEQPYSLATSTEEVISCLRRNERLPRPNTPDCDDAVYKMMLSCWESERRKRPTFAYFAEQLHEWTQVSKNADNQTDDVAATSPTTANGPEENSRLLKATKSSVVV